MNIEIPAGVVDALAEAVADRVLASLPVAAQAPEWRLVTVDDVAAMLGRSRRWVHGAVRDRGLPHVRLDGGGLLFDVDDVRRWALARRVPAALDDAEWLQGGCTVPRSRSTNGVLHGRRIADQKVRP